MKIVVFDFDKTLTNTDTLFGFYKITNNPGIIFNLKRVLLIISAIGFKLQVINNTKLKKIGVFLFLRGKDKSEIIKKGEIYSRKIILNQIYDKDFTNYKNEEILIVSASLEEYLKPLFKDIQVVGSKLDYSKALKVKGLKSNVYGKNKKVILEKKGYKYIDILYTDSYSDKAIMNISKKVYLVTNGIKRIIKVHGDE